jgi:hypothetical protein
MTVNTRARNALLGTFFAGLLASGGWAAGDIIVPHDPPKCGDRSEPAPVCPVSLAARPKAPETIVSSRRIRLNYEIRDVGPSGVSRVELWCTRDGRTWQRYSNDRPAQGPLLVQVAEEGRYGFTVAVKSGVGAGDRAPVEGDAPQLWVNVDETKPVVQVHEVRAGQGAEAGTLFVSWSASDSHLKARPFTISYATNREGPWHPIATDIDRNTCQYVWRNTKGAPCRFFVRVEAADRAGNVGSDTSPRPVTIDPAQPHGVILGVDTESAGPPASKRP